MDPQSPSTGPARRWTRRLLAVIWPLALAGAVVLAVALSRSESPDARAERDAKADSQQPIVPHLVRPATRKKDHKSKRVRVPDIKGFRPEMAQRALGRRHLELMAFGRESLLPSGTIVDQSPRPGKRVRRGSDVRVYLAIEASGKMPEVIGHDVAQAASDLWAVGLVIRFAYRRVDAPERDGTVLEQSPPTGYDVHPGQRVWLLVARR